MLKVNIISGWSNPGGSTIHHIGLTNLLNKNGFDCIFYGPHTWHLDKCKSGELSKLDGRTLQGNIVISHFVHPGPINNCSPAKHILSCHESPTLFPIRKLDYTRYDFVQFVSNRQKGYHKLNHPSVIIPPLVSKFEWVAPKTNTFGVIGSIDSNKQTHISIEAALKDGANEVLLFGDVTDTVYFDSVVSKVLTDKVKLAGHMDDKQLMYSKLDRVYHNSKSETYGLVEAECSLNNIPFIGRKNDPLVLSEEEILALWKKYL